MEVLPGCVLKRNNNNITVDSFWDPVNFLSIHVHDNFNNKIMPILDLVVNRIMKNANRVCLQLSGGLDSTVLFFSIKENWKLIQQFTVINYLDRSVASTDESKYAKSLANESKIELIFHELKYGFEPKINIKWNRPHPALLGIDSKKALLHALGRDGIDLVNGHGGDQLFLENIDESFLVDYFIDNGFKGFWNILKKISLIKRSTIFSHSYPAFKSLLGHYIHLNPSYDTFLLPERKDWFTDELDNLICSNIYLPPFWNKLINSNIKPGKIKHILDVYHGAAFSSFEFPGITEVYPYLFQPIVELGLSFPVYETFNEQWTRLHFRQAAATKFNTDKVWRHYKGEWSGVMQSCIRANMKRVEELCMEGQFARNKLIHKDLLRKHIQHCAHGKIDQQWLILQLLSLELWFESWSEII